MKVEERFLKYVSYWTTSCDGQEQIPSTDRQFELGHALADELRELGLSRVNAMSTAMYMACSRPQRDMKAKSPSVLSRIWIPRRIFPERMYIPRSFRNMTGRM